MFKKIIEKIKAVIAKIVAFFKKKEVVVEAQIDAKVADVKAEAAKVEQVAKDKV